MIYNNIVTTPNQKHLSPRYRTPILELPWAELAEEIGNLDPRKDLAKEHRTILENFIEVHKLKLREELYPHLLAHIAHNWKINNGIKEFLAEKLQDPHERGIYYFLASPVRALESQCKNAQYSRATPLILAAYKLYNNVPYESWRDKKDLDFLVGKELIQTMYYEQELTKIRLLELREMGLTIGSGSKQGQQKSINTYSLYGLGSTELAEAPLLSKMMLCQTWCYHPKNRHKLMIQQTKDWDQESEPLLIDEIFESRPKVEQTIVADDLPWA